MLARVLFFFLAFVPVCRAEYYDADEDIDRGESYDRYNEEIKEPLKFTTVMEGLTRLKRWDMDDLATLDEEEPIVDVKDSAGVPANILQGDQLNALRGPRNPLHDTDSYSYVENAVPDRAEYLPNQKKKFHQWMLTVSNRSPEDGKQENTIESSSESVKEQHWSFVYQPATSTKVKNDIIAEVRKLQPIQEGEDSRRFSTETHFTTEGTESTIDSNNYPQETTTYNPSEMQAEVKKLVQHWSPATIADNYPQEVTKYNPSEMQAEVKKLVQHWSPATNADNYPQEVTKYNPSEMQVEVKKLLQHWSPATNADNYPQVMKYNPSEMQAEVKKLVQHWSPANIADEESEIMRAGMRNPVQHWSPSASIQDMSTSSRHSDRTHTSRVQHWRPARIKSPIPKMNQQTAKMQTVLKELEPHISRFKQEHWNPVNLNASDNVQQFVPAQELSSSVGHPQRSSIFNILIVSRTMDAQHWTSVVADNLDDLAFNSSDDFKDIATKKYILRQEDDSSKTTLNTTTTAMNTTTTALNTTTTALNATCITAAPTTEETTTPTTTTYKTQIDIEKIIAIIANLTEDYEWNLTEQFNKSLIEHSVPTCPWKELKWGPGGIWTATTTVTTPVYDFDNSPLVTKCFVCGLTDPRIPENAFCADAFAGDFLPLLPIDARSRGKVAGYRKYCNYLNVSNYVENSMDPRAIYGRFTGGCAVRWTDITGIYTQRTCRVEKRPLLGQHFASKRMAKLELALVPRNRDPPNKCITKKDSVEVVFFEDVCCRSMFCRTNAMGIKNGCIISPMATLLPVSRGISLYARFHACVCTGNWCNRAILIKVSTNTVVAFVLYWFQHNWPS